MSWMDEVSSLLQQYKGASASSPPPNAPDDFAKVADRAPASALSSGLAAAFRSQSTPPFGQMISQLFAQSDGTQRAGILNHLIAAAGPAAAGILGSRAGSAGSDSGSGSAAIAPQQTSQISSEAVRRLADEAEKRDPSVVDRAGEFYAQHPTLVKSLGVGALALVMSHLSQRH